MNKRHALLVVLIFAAQLLGAVLPAASLAAFPYDTAIATARLEIWKALSNGASAAAVAVLDDDRIVYSEGFGMRDREQSLPIDTNTQFNIGSISKVFTAASILLLTEDGLIELDKPVTEYLPEFTMADSRYVDITVRMLLNHTSGIPGTIWKGAMGSEKNRDFVGETLAILQRSKLKHNPGEISIYCNDALTVAEAIVERVSGMSFSDFLNTRVFSQAGMINSSCYFRDGNANIARTYDGDSNTALPVEYVNPLASGGIASTAEDLVRFARSLWTNSLLAPASMEEFMKPQYGPRTVPEGIPEWARGLGWDHVALEHFARQGKTVLAKDGATTQFIAQLYVAPHDKLSVALTFAGYGGDPGVIATEILQAVMEGKGLVSAIADETQLPSPDAPIPAELLPFAGYYGSSVAIFKLEFDTEASRMNLSVYDGGVFSLVDQLRYAENGYFYMGDGSRLSLAEALGTRFMLQYHDDLAGCQVMAELIPEGDPTIGGSLFDNKTWIARNIDYWEFAQAVLASRLITELPGYIQFQGGPYALADEHTAVMVLSHGRDLAEPRLSERDGELWLEAYGLLLADASRIAELVPGESICIGSNGLNEWRRATVDGVFSAATGTRSRVVVYSPAGDYFYDSLMTGDREILLKAGSYVGFIGEPGMQFRPLYRPTM